MMKLITKQRAKMILAQKGLKVKKSYTHENYICTSLAVPYPIKNKIDRICKKHGLTRSGLIQLLVEEFKP